MGLALELAFLESPPLDFVSILVSALVSAQDSDAAVEALVEDLSLAEGFADMFVFVTFYTIEIFKRLDVSGTN